MFAFRSILGSPTPIRQYHTLRFKTFPLYCHSLENNKHSQVLVMPLTCQSKGWFGFYAKKKQNSSDIWHKIHIFFTYLLTSFGSCSYPVSKGIQAKVILICSACVSMWSSIQSWPQTGTLMLLNVYSSTLSVREHRCMALHDLYVISWYISAKLGYLVHPGMMGSSMTKWWWLMSWALLLTSVGNNMHICLRRYACIGHIGIQEGIGRYRLLKTTHWTNTVLKKKRLQCLSV